MSSDTIAMIIGGIIGLLAGSIGAIFFLALFGAYKSQQKDYSK